MSHWVVHLKRDHFDVRIDRATDWGNPFAIGRDGTREEVIAKFRTWFMGEVAMMQRAKRELRGKVLGCWCSPKACHGDVLAEIANGCDHNDGTVAEECRICGKPVTSQSDASAEQK
jgi:hypothetical protein